MRLYTFEHEGTHRVGAEFDGKLVDLRAAYGVAIEPGQAADGATSALLGDMLALIGAGDQGMQAARQALTFAAASPDPSSQSWSYAFDQIRLLAPITRPVKILCSGVNYQGHVDENPGAILPESPFFFAKLPSAVIGPGAPIILPRRSRQVDYEVELAVVIGRRLHGPVHDQVLDSVFGYTILHDVSARDVQFKDAQITLGKNFDSFAPLGPCIVTADELTDPANLRLRTLVNGQILQDGNTRDWVFPLPVLIDAVAQVMTLEPGDIVTTGTPAGVGTFRRPQVFLQPGDQVVLEVERIGRLENPVVAEA